MSVILLGDFYQIPPVLGNPLYSPSAEDWEMMFRFQTSELTENVRQQDDIPFATFLRRLRDNDLTAEDASFFGEREHVVRDCNNKLKGDAYTQVMTDGYFLGIFARNDDRRQWNRVHINKCTGRNIVTKVLETRNHTKQLRILELKKGCRVMLTTNLDEELTNGTLGTLLGFEWSQKHEEAVCTSADEPIAVWIASDDDQRHFRITKKLLNGHSQFPLQLAYGMTAHKVQCKTFAREKKIFVDCYSMTKAQMYVAFSRVQYSHQLSVAGFSTQVQFLAKDTQNSLIQEFWRCLKVNGERSGHDKFVCIWNLTDEKTFKRYKEMPPSETILVGGQDNMSNYTTLNHVRVSTSLPWKWMPRKYNSIWVLKHNGKDMLVVRDKPPRSLTIQIPQLIVHPKRRPKCEIQLLNTANRGQKLFPWDPHVWILDI